MICLWSGSSVSTVELYLLRRFSVVLAVVDLAVLLFLLNGPDVYVGVMFL